MDEDLPLKPDMYSARVFRYGFSRAGIVLLGLLAGLLGLLAWTYATSGAGAFTGEALAAAGLVGLMLGGILLPVPLMEIAWWARGRVVVNAEGVFWRGWGRFTGEQWSEIIAIGRPPSDAGPFDDERIHVVTEDDYRFIHGFNLRRRDEALEAMRAWGGFAESKRIGGYSFICRHDRIGEVEERTREHVGTEIAKPYRFWAGRFRRF